jgi:hypothetical protein
VAEWWPWAAALVALSVVLRPEPRRNLLVFMTSRPMGPDDDWPETRVKATMEAYARIISYAHERRERFHQYESNWTRTRFRVVQR